VVTGIWIRLALALSGMLVVSCDFAVSGGIRLAGLDGDAPASGPEQACVESCRARAPHCSRHECARGCNLVLDRLVEREGPPVIACVARAKTCDDALWASCGSRIGLYADGGPPAPPPSHDEEGEEE
jgi:hypothetical protein